MRDFATTLPNELALIKQSVVDSSAFAAIYDHYFSRIYNYVRYRVHDADTTDDLTSLIFERVLINLASYHPDKAPFAAWLFAIARNTINDHLRAQRRRQWLSLDVIRDWAVNEPSPGDTVSQREIQSDLLAAVARLGSRERDIIALKFAGGLTNRRIAELTGLSESNVGVILYRTVRRLRTELEAHGVEL
ncbi:MAG: sigma-70 family RNA polymerase sigma factor [Anaerolineae bacterium]|nr:sigma-70 family RNA polymerase sigma factor [Anaerolineae bacterium]